MQNFPQVVREVSGQSAAPDELGSPVIPRKCELDKVSVGDGMFTRAYPRHFSRQVHNSSSQLRRAKLGSKQAIVLSQSISLSNCLCTTIPAFDSQNNEEISSVIRCQGYIDRGGRRAIV